MQRLNSTTTAPTPPAAGLAVRRLGNRAATVLLIGNFLSSSGGSRGVCEELAERLTAAGWEVLAASRKRARLPRLLDMIASARRWRNEYPVAQVDVYSGNAFFWAEAVCAMLRWIDKPYVLSLHGGNLPDFARRWPRRVSRLLRSATAVTVPSRYLAEHMAPYRADLRVLVNALDVRGCPFRLRAPPRRALTWLRAFHKIYNPVLAPQVLQLLTAEFPDLQLTMIGPDKGDGSLAATRHAAAALGVLDRMRFVGQVPKAAVPGWLDQGDIFLNTTNIDNAPVSTLEAMACGLCVVSTNVGGLPYLLADGTDALLVPPNDPVAMAAAVRRLLTEPALAARLSPNARHKAEQHDWAVVLPQWEALLRRAGLGGVLPACPERSLSQTADTPWLIR